MQGLTIGQLAEHVGVTIRAVRHYHQRGLLPEPERDASGYRRYGAAAVVDLIRIKTLSDAGVPLVRIEELLTAQPAEFAAAISEIDEALDRKIRDLAEHRRRIAELARVGGERLFLPEEIISLMDQLRAIGVSERTVQVERDAWILMAALSPELVGEWARVKLWALKDPEFRRIYLLGDEAFGWDADDPRLPALAEAMMNWAVKRDQVHDPAAVQGTAEATALLSLVYADLATASPAWGKLDELTKAPPQP